LFTSLAGIIVALFAMGAIYTLPTVPTTAVVVIMMAYLMLFGLGMSPIPWTMNAEIHPMSVRAQSISASTATNWLMNYVVSQTFLSLSVSLSTSKDCPRGHPNGVFWLFGSIGVIGLVGFALTLPETKGKSLEEIQELFIDAKDHRHVDCFTPRTPKTPKVPAEKVHTIQL